MTTLSKNKVLLGLSGGVDSTAAALLLKEQGFAVIGYYFDVTGQNQKGTEEAEKLARQLHIPFLSENVAEEFSDKVIAHFCSEYACGRTPNPCILCNPEVKFRHLLQAAEQEGAFYIATGHYADCVYDSRREKYYVTRAASQRKDQSYMLYRLGQETLSRLLLPLGTAEGKEKVRELVRRQGISNADVSDSQEICFIDETREKYTDFLRRRGVKIQEGDFLDQEGRVLGRHRGICCYTVGQRKGLGIALGKPAFVVSIDARQNTVTLGSNEDLFGLQVRSVENFFTETGGEELPERFAAGAPVEAKIRYGAKPAQAKISVMENGDLLTVFDQPQRAAAPGQSIVFYENGRVIGGGFIR